jgi:hypothetical protein
MVRAINPTFGQLDLTAEGLAYLFVSGGRSSPTFYLHKLSLQPDSLLFTVGHFYYFTWLLFVALSIAGAPLSDATFLDSTRLRQLQMMRREGSHRPFEDCGYKLQQTRANPTVTPICALRLR